MNTSCWGRNNEVNDSDANVINLYYTGNHYDWLSKDMKQNRLPTIPQGGKNPIMEATITAMSQFGGGRRKGT